AEREQSGLWRQLDLEGSRTGAPRSPRRHFFYQQYPSAIRGEPSLTTIGWVDSSPLHNLTIPVRYPCSSPLPIMHDSFPKEADYKVSMTEASRQGQVGRRGITSGSVLLSSRTRARDTPRSQWD